MKFDVSFVREMKMNKCVYIHTFLGTWTVPLIMLYQKETKINGKFAKTVQQSLIYAGSNQ